ncbi:DUF4932 domain-containing protein [Chryseobacterium arachidis]
MIMIKKLLGLSMLVISILSFSQEKLMPKVDERIEIVSLVFRLAGADEYTQDDNKKYVADINTYFDRHKNSEIVEFIQKNRNKGLGYDAVISMALHLSFENGKFSLIKEKENSLDKRWEQVDIRQFVSLLNRFYKQSGFQKFFKDHSEDYKKAEKEYENSILSDFNQGWFSKFYGKDADEEYKIILGYGNGDTNYGIKTHPEKQNTTVNAVIGVSNFDKEGNARFEKSKYQPLLIHEFNHSFVNYILELNGNRSKLENSAQKLYRLIENELKDQAYGDWETMINESIVRAVVIRYMIDNHYSQKDIETEVSAQEKRKFLWIKELVNLLATYESNRKQYPTLESFYPEIIAFYNEIAPKMQMFIPKVLSVFPEIRDKNDVDSSIKEITINFDQEMTGNGSSFSMGSLGKEHFPLKKFDGYINENKGIKLQVEMKPNTEYEFVINGDKFISKDGYPLQKTIIKFKTK